MEILLEITMKNTSILEIKKVLYQTKIKIHNPKFYFNIIRGGSSALGESYIKNEFETLNLPSLIELLQKNIDI